MTGKATASDVIESWSKTLTGTGLAYLGYYLFDKECMDALMELCKIEGIIPAIESAHALAHVIKMAQGDYKGKTIIMCLSGRGDKDVNTVAKYLNGEETNK